MGGKKYRLYGRATRVEKSSQQVDFATRKPADQNMLVFMVQEIKYSDTIYKEGADAYMLEKTTLFKYSIISLCVILLITVLLTIFTLIKFQVVNPVERITKFIMKPDKQDKETLDLFIDEILRKAERK